MIIYTPRPETRPLKASLTLLVGTCTSPALQAAIFYGSASTTMSCSAKQCSEAQCNISTASRQPKPQQAKQLLLQVLLDAGIFAALLPQRCHRLAASPAGPPEVSATAHALYKQATQRHLSFCVLEPQMHCGRYCWMPASVQLCCHSAAAASASPAGTPDVSTIARCKMHFMVTA